jgi:hypothetical protein
MSSQYKLNCLIAKNGTVLKNPTEFAKLGAWVRFKWRVYVYLWRSIICEQKI